MTREEVLAKAAELVEAGWTQGILMDDHGRVCARGAIYAACGFDLTAGDVRRTEASRGRESLAYRCHEALTAELGGLIAVWNDAPGRTKEEVVTALRNAKRWL